MNIAFGRHWILTSAFFALLLLASACGKHSTAASGTDISDLDNLVPTGEQGGLPPGAVFKVGFEDGFKPYGFKDPSTGKFTGYDIELAEEVARRRSWKILFIPIIWADKDKLINQGDIDCIWNGFSITGREKLYEWTEPYCQGFQVMVTRTTDHFRDFASLAGHPIGLEDGSTVQTQLMEGTLTAIAKSFGALVKCQDLEEPKTRLTNGAVDGIVVDITIAQKMIKELDNVGNPRFSILAQPLLLTVDGVAFKLGRNGLRNQVQNTMKEMVKDGTFAQITTKWWGNLDTLCLTAD